MESTNELVPKVLAATEGFSIPSSNECLTKREFAENFKITVNIGEDTFNKSINNQITVVNSTNRIIRIRLSDKQTVDSEAEYVLTKEIMPGQVDIFVPIASTASGTPKTFHTLEVLNTETDIICSYLLTYVWPSKLVLGDTSGYKVLVDMNLPAAGIVLDYRASHRYGHFVNGTMIFKSA